MSTLTFYVGELPTTPLVITVRNEDGSIKDLGSYDTVEFVGDELPAGTASIANASQGRVQYDFSAPFENAVSLLVQVKMESSGGADYSSPVVIQVLDPAETVITLVTPSQVEAWTNVSVTNGDVVRAQGIVMLAVGRDLTDDDVLDFISPQDTFWLQQAVAWQAAEHPSSTTATVQLPYVPGASSITNGDVSITYADSSVEMPELAANASVALKRVSWMRPVRTLHATGFLGRRCEPDPWLLMYRTTM